MGWSFLLLLVVGLAADRRQPVLAVLAGPDPDDSGVNGAGDAVLVLETELRDGVGISEGGGCLEVPLERGINNVLDHEPLDRLVLGTQPPAVRADDGLDVSSVLLVPAVVPPLDWHP
jgi:hypothetical protein